MQGLVHTVLTKIIKGFTFSFMTGRGKTTTHSSQTRADGEGVVRKGLHLAAQVCPSLPLPPRLHPGAPRSSPVRSGICPQSRTSPPTPAAKGGERLAPSMAGLWTIGSQRARRAQGMRWLRMAGVTLRQAKEQQYKSFQLTQSIYTGEISALCWPKFNTADQTPDDTHLRS